jgi:ribokinase
VAVTVVGSLNEDVLIGVGRLPGRGETVIGSTVQLAPGGKGANQAAAAARLGGGVAMVGRVGADAAGERQRRALADLGVDVGGVRTTAGAPTGSATIPVEDGTGENLIVVVPGANGHVLPRDVAIESVRTARVVLLQLEIPLDAVTAAAHAARGTVVLTPAPPRPLPADLLARVGVLVPNEHELAQLGGVEPRRRTVPELVGLLRTVTRRAAVVTLGDRGALVIPDDGAAALLQPAPPVTPVDTTGAGDCFSGALAQALAAGLGLADAARRAVTAASLSTTGAGARDALPDAAAVEALLPDTPTAVPLDVDRLG